MSTSLYDLLDLLATARDLENIWYVYHERNYVDQYLVSVDDVTMVWSKDKADAKVFGTEGEALTCIDSSILYNRRNVRVDSYSLI